MKQVHWQLPFASLDGNRYRIDIYDDPASSADGGQSWPVQLVGAGIDDGGPLTTDGDTSENFFESIRPQTGNIHIVNTSGELSIYDILPNDNTDRPVRVINETNGALEWQGYLKCETYTQGYNARPQQIDLTIISVLEAMASAKYHDDKPSMLQVKKVISNILSSCEGDIISFGTIYVPFRSIRFLSKYIDTTVLYKLSPISNEYHTSYIVEPKDSKYALDRICAYMGWVAQEVGNDIYLIDSSDDNYCAIQRADIESFSTLTPVATHTWDGKQMRDMRFHGTGHSISVAQGAKRVEVSASLDGYEVDTNIPDQCPVEEETEQHIGTCTTYHSNDILFDDRCEFNNWDIMVDSSDPQHPYIRQINPTSVAETFNYSAIKRDTLNEPNMNYHVGAFMAILQDDATDKSNKLDRTSGLFVSAMEYGAALRYGFTPTSSNHVFRLDSKMRLAASSGKIKISIHGHTLVRQDTQVMPQLAHPDRVAIMCALKCGDMYYDADEEAELRWKEQISYFPISTETEEEFEAVVSASGLNGTVELFIYPVSPITGTSLLKEQMLITDLDVSYEPKEGLNERDANHYSRFTGKAFSDDVTIDSVLTTDMNNRTAPNIVRESEIVPMRMLDYINQDYTTKTEKPELVLLERALSYYSEPRTIISLEVEHKDGVKPLTRITGYDGKTYLPLSESRNWGTGVSTIQCFECPKGN